MEAERTTYQKEVVRIGPPAGSSQDRLRPFPSILVTSELRYGEALWDQAQVEIHWHDDSPWARKMTIEETVYLGQQLRSAARDADEMDNRHGLWSTASTDHSADEGRAGSPAAG